MACASRCGVNHRRFRRDLDRADTIDLAINALFQAADEDSATGGPDPVRGIYPLIATITGADFERVGDDEVAERFRSLVDRLSTTDSTTTAKTVAGGDAR